VADGQPGGHAAAERLADDVRPAVADLADELRHDIRDVLDVRGRPRARFVEAGLDSTSSRWCSASAPKVRLSKRKPPPPCRKTTTGPRPSSA
jgi:hypothetical protein